MDEFNSAGRAVETSGPAPAHHICMRTFEPGDEAAFHSLNEVWISKYFGMEEKDRAVLGDPVGQIIGRGGQIYMALHSGEPVGCCALLPLEAGVFEVAKMAVAEKYRGQGIGRKVLEYTVMQAKAFGATRLYLETNKILANAIHLYESVGFRHLPPARVVASAYARANVYMEMFL